MTLDRASGADPNADYTVELEVYTGPMDLLLYLIRRHELDIFDIPIALITDQFMGYVDTIQELDLGLAGEFLVMAATLAEIKSNMMLPKPQELADDQDDPRLELVRQLLDYKKFKDLGEVLTDRRDRFAKRAERGFSEVPGPRVESGPYLEEVSIWDLFRAFQELARDTLSESGVIIHSDRPVREYIAQISKALQARHELSFRALFAEATDRMTIIGLFLALLELVRLGCVRCRQPERQGDILVCAVDGASWEHLPLAEPYGELATAT